MPQPALRHPGIGVSTGHPSLVRVPRQRRRALHPGLRWRDQALGNAGALGQVVVIRPDTAGLHIVTRASRRTAIRLHPAVHLQTPTNNNQQWFVVSLLEVTALPILVASVPFGVKS